ncbi:MAG TPA: fatty acid CoA ligase family protein, partial [Candidatus Synoicihabitans sp.]|nr:fatty acid CoA ligase family protein [Candidatus Synoicihabitans sp.]
VAMAAAQPTRAALKVPRGRDASGAIDYLTLSFTELAAEVAAWQQRLRRAGVQRGDRVLVMVRQGLPLIAAVFAVFALGAVPVVIDPGMGRRQFLACVNRSRPRVLLGIPLARVLSHVFRHSFRSVQVRIGASARTTARVARSGPGSARVPEIAESAPSELAAILFTSGSTGAPKGVRYEHGMFAAQVQMIRDTYHITPGEIDLPMLPIFALFNPALGMTTVVPEIDPSRPATVDPAKIVQAIQQESVTNSFGSPTLWARVADYCAATGTTLPTLKRVLCAGAPVPASLWDYSRRMLPHGQMHSPYGATEALPVSTISAAEIDPAAVRGACVGRPVNGVGVKVIALHDGPLASLDETRELRNGEIGEIIVCGPMVTKAYDENPEATAAAKIQTPLTKPQNNPGSAPAAGARFGVCDLAFGVSPPFGGIWHRMGDCGYFDAEGRLWFCGRKVERVETAAGRLHTEPCEQVFRPHPLVARCALIGLGDPGAQEPALVVQRRRGRLHPPLSNTDFARELRTLATRHPHTASIRRFFFHPRFPVDVRHNAKIHRLTLTRWAAHAPAVTVNDAATS